MTKRLASFLAIAWLGALSIAAIAAICVWEVLLMLGGMTCDYRCNILMPAAVVGLPVALVVAALIGWTAFWLLRSRGKNVLWVLALSLTPIGLDLGVYMLGAILVD